MVSGCVCQLMNPDQGLSNIKSFPLSKGGHSFIRRSLIHPFVPSVIQLMDSNNQCSLLGMRYWKLYMFWTSVCLRNYGTPFETKSTVISLCFHRLWLERRTTTDRNTLWAATIPYLNIPTPNFIVTKYWPIRVRMTQLNICTSIYTSNIRILI